jgi:hypothetical protein
MARIGWILLSAVLLMALIASTAIAQQETWQQIGLTGNNLLCAAVATGNSNLIVAGGTNLYVSTDGGTNSS